MEDIKLKPCKVCGAMPELYQPEVDRNIPFHRQPLSYPEYKPPPYYRCAMCLHLKEKRNKEKLIQEWNEKQE